MRKMEITVNIWRPFCTSGRKGENQGLYPDHTNQAGKKSEEKGSGPDIDPGNRSGDRNGFSGRYSDEGRTSASKFSADCRREHIGNGYAGGI